MSISPDGKWVAFIVGQALYELNGYRSGLFVVSTTADPQVRSLGTAGTPHWDEINQWISEDPQWSANSQVIWYRARLKESEHWQIWNWRLPSGQRRQVTHAAGDVETYQVVSHGQALFLTVTTRRSVETRPNSYQAGILFPGPIRPYETIPVKTQLKLAEGSLREYWIHDLRTGRERRATEKEAREWRPKDPTAVEDLNAEERQALAKYHLVDAKESPDRAGVAYTYLVDDPSVSKMWARRLLLRSAQTHLVKELTPDSYYIDQYWWDADGTDLYFTQRRGVGRSHELWRTTRDGSSVQLLFKAVGTDYFSSFSSDRSGRWLACLVEDNTTPPRVALMDSATQQVRTLVDLNPDFDSLEREPAERIEGNNQYGESWYGHLVKPIGYTPGVRYPLIVTTYRSGDYFLRGASGDQNPIQVYAANGFAVLSFDVGMRRNIRPGHFEEKIADWASPTASLEAAIRELSDRGIIDQARVGIAGFSHGEEIAGYALTHTDIFRAAVGAALYEPYFYFMAGPTWWRLFDNWGLGKWPYGNSRSNWEQIAMSARAEHIKAAILENASDTEFLFYLPLYRSLVDLGKPVELYIYPDELHVRNQPRHRLEVYERNLDWFRFWLKGEEDPDPAKVDQYARWREMRKLQESNRTP